MRVQLNGAAIELSDQANVAEAVSATGAPLEGRGIAVALEGEVVPRGQWERTILREGQSIEVVTAIQGG